MAQKRHGAAWWIFIGWWWYPVKWIYFSIPVFIIRKIIEAVKNSRNESQNTPPSKKETYVYVTTGGKKFHYDLLCPGIRNSKEIKMELSKARKAGYTACDKCCYDYLHE